MERTFHSIYSQALGRHLETLIFGHAGRPMLVFPSSEGRFFDWENFGMVDTVAPFIDAGKLRVICVDGIDGESWFAPAHPVDKARRANTYDWAIVNEVVPYLRRIGVAPAGLMCHGVSFGAYHTVNFYLRHPDVFDLGLALSGCYSIAFLTGGFVNEDVFFHDPVMYLPGLSDPWYLDHLKKDLLLICCGQGAWEDWLGEAKHVSHHLGQKDIPHVLDLWGHDVNHDWPWWRKQIVYHLDMLDQAGFLTAEHRMTEQESRDFATRFPHIPTKINV